MRRDVLGFNAQAEHLQRIVMLRDADEIGEVAQSGGPATAHDVGCVRRARADLEGQRAEFDRHVTFFEAPANRESARSRAERRVDDIAPDTHDHRIVVDESAGHAESTPRLRKQNFHSELFENSERRLMDRLDAILGEDGLGNEWIAQPAIVDFPTLGRSLLAPAAPASSRHARIALPAGS